VIVRHNPAPTIARTISPDVGETIVVRTDYVPWFLGFCRWTVERRSRPGDYSLVSCLKSGSWNWRGREAELVETLVEDPK
jgi:hypothetical protein